MGPTLRDWALLVGSGAFTAVGLWLFAIGEEPGTALATVAFSGLCTAVAAVFVWEKRRMAALAAVPGVVEASGERIPQSRVRLVVTGLALAVAGGLMAAADGFPWPFTLASLAIAATGLALLAGLAIGRLGHRWLRFEPEGLRLGERRGSVLLPWDDLVGCQVWELHSNPVVSVHLRDPARALATAEPPSYAATAATLMPGGAVTLFPMWFAMDAGLLARSLDTYVRHPERRAALGRPRLGG